MIDKVRQRQNAEWALSMNDAGPMAEVAGTLLRILDDPTLVVPEGFALIRLPELRGHLTELAAERDAWRAKKDSLTLGVSSTRGLDVATSIVATPAERRDFG